MTQKSTKRLILISLMLICVVILLELYARFIIKQPYYAFPRGYFIDNEFYGYELAKDFKGSYSQPEFTISINTNSQGLRDIERAKAGKSFKILALGDSLAFGMGVELKDTYLTLLERMLNDARRRKRYAIIKAGIVEYSTYNERIYLEKEGLDYEPDMVLIQFWWDDLGVNRITHLPDIGFLTTGRINDFAHFRLFLNRYVRSYAFLRGVLARRLNFAVFAKKRGTVSQTVANLRNKFAITLKEFQKIKSACRENHAKNLFILVPPKRFVYSKQAQVEQWEAFCSLLDENDIDYIDAMPVLKKAAEQRLRPFFKVDPHLNKSGHILLAQEVHRHLSSLGY